LGLSRSPTNNKEKIMRKDRVLKGLLAVSTVAAMFSAYGVQAQTVAYVIPSANDLAQMQNDNGRQNLTGKTTIDGTVGNTNSQGTEMHPNAAMRGASGTQGTSQSGMSSMSAQNSSGMNGTTTRDGTVGNTNSQGTENRTNGSANGSTSGMSGSSGMDGTQGSSQGSTPDMSAQSGSSSGSTGTSAGTGQTSGSAASQGATSAGAASGSASGSLSKSDQKILMGMAQANIDEVEAGKMAQSKSQNDQVKSFAQQMIDDHSKALTDVQQVAQQKGVTLPTEPDAKHKAMAAKLEKMNGAAFDKAYMANAGAADHKKVLSTLKADQKRAKDADVKALAEKMTPVVEQHLKAAQQIGTPKSRTTSGR
jgi:putative membrane protein